LKELDLAKQQQINSLKNIFNKEAKEENVGKRSAGRFEKRQRKDIHNGNKLKTIRQNTLIIKKQKRKNETAVINSIMGPCPEIFHLLRLLIRVKSASAFSLCTRLSMKWCE